MRQLQRVKVNRDRVEELPRLSLNDFNYCRRCTNNVHSDKFLCDLCALCKGCCPHGVARLQYSTGSVRQMIEVPKVQPRDTSFDDELADLDMQGDVDLDDVEPMTPIGDVVNELMNRISFERMLNGGDE
jgi:hypothetical protein